MGTTPDSPLTPLGEAIRRLRVRIELQAQPLVLVHASDLFILMDALMALQAPPDEGGEA